MSQQYQTRKKQLVTFHVTAKM